MAEEVYRIEIPVVVEDHTDPALRQAQDRVTRFDQSMQRTEQQIRRMNQTKLQIIASAVDKASHILDKVGRAAYNLSVRPVVVTITAIDRVTKPFRSIISKLAPMAVIGLTLVGGFGLHSSMKTFMDFEQTMANVKAITGATDKDFTRLTETAKQLGATTVWTAKQAAEGMTYLGMAGWKANDIIAAMPGLLNLASAGQVDLARATDIVSDVMTAFGIEAAKAGHAADVFAYTATNSNTTIEMLGEAMKYAAPIAKSFGLSLEQTAAIAGKMADAGIKASMAGTAIRSALLRLADPRARAEMMLDRLGLSFTDTAGNMLSMTQIIRDVSSAFSKLSSSEKLSAAQRIFGVEAASAWLAVIDQGPDKLAEFTKALEKADGAANKMADIQLDTLQGSLLLLQSAVDGLKMKIGERLAPYFRSFAFWLTSKIPDIERVFVSALDKMDAKVKVLKNSVAMLTNSQEWKNAATLSEKMKLAWDKVIVEPFDQWWNSGGQQWVTNIAGKIGGGMGGIIGGFLQAALGLPVQSKTTQTIKVNTQGNHSAALKAMDTDLAYTLRKYGEAPEVINQEIIKMHHQLRQQGLLNEMPGIEMSISSVETNPFIDAGTAAGKAFFDAFWTAFDTEALAKKLLDAFKDIVIGSTNVVHFGKPATAGNYLEAVIMTGVTAGVLKAVGGGFRALKSGKEALKSVDKAWNWVKGLRGGGAATRTAEMAADAASSMGGSAANIARAAGSGTAIYGARGQVLSRVPELGEASRAVAGTAGRVGIDTASIGLKSLFKAGGRAIGKIALPLAVTMDVMSVTSAKPGEERSRAVGGSVGGWGGFAAGGAAGAAIGSVVPGIGTAIGGIVGGIVGGIIGGVGGSFLGDWIGGKIGKSGEIQTDIVNSAANAYDTQQDYVQTTYDAQKELARKAYDAQQYYARQAYDAQQAMYKAAKDTNAAPVAIVAMADSVISALGAMIGQAILGRNTMSTASQTNSANSTIYPSNAGSMTSKVNASPSVRHLNLVDLVPHAQGGVITRPHVGLVGEAGPEVIIPLSKRSRGIDLWEQAGALLGVHPYANGGFVGNSQGDYDSDSTFNVPTAKPKETSEKTQVNVNVQISLSPSYKIDTAAEAKDVLAVLKEYQHEIADELQDKIAQSLEKVFSNLPNKPDYDFAW